MPPHQPSNQCRCIDCSPRTPRDISRDICERLREAEGDNELSESNCQELAYDIKALTRLHDRVIDESYDLPEERWRYTGDEIEAARDARDFVDHALDSYDFNIIRLENILGRENNRLRMSQKDLKLARSMVFAVRESLYCARNVASSSCLSGTIEEISALVLPECSSPPESLAGSSLSSNDEQSDTGDAPVRERSQGFQDAFQAEQNAQGPATTNDEDTPSLQSDSADIEPGVDDPSQFLRIGSQVLGFVDAFLEDLGRPDFFQPTPSTANAQSDRADGMTGLKSVLWKVSARLQSM